MGVARMESTKARALARSWKKKTENMIMSKPRVMRVAFMYVLQPHTCDKQLRLVPILAGLLFHIQSPNPDHGSTSSDLAITLTSLSTNST